MYNLNNMKPAIVRVPFFIKKNNMKYFLKGRIIGNLDKLIDIVFKNGKDIYEPRREQRDNEYPDVNDIVKAKALSIAYIDDSYYVDIELVDSLYFSKLKEPCIKINGYCTEEDGVINITKVTRLTLADKFEPESQLVL